MLIFWWVCHRILKTQCAATLSRISMLPGHIYASTSHSRSSILRSCHVPFFSVHMGPLRLQPPRCKCVSKPIIHTHASGHCKPSLCWIRLGLIFRALQTFSPRTWLSFVRSWLSCASHPPQNDQWRVSMHSCTPEGWEGTIILCIFSLTA